MHVDGTCRPYVRSPEELLQAAVEGVMTNPTEICNTMHITFANEGAPVATLNLELRTDENRQGFLADVLVNILPMNVQIEMTRTRPRQYFAT